MQNIVPIINIFLTIIAIRIFNTFRESKAGMSRLIRQFNTYMFLRLPSAWWCGVRLESLTETEAQVRVRHRWVNQNPFRSMYWAVQGMAAEFASGALVTDHIRRSGQQVSMLVLNNKTNFSKKATGLIRFRCEDGAALKAALEQALLTGEGQTVWMKSVGTDSQGDTVSTFLFEWTLKVRPSSKK